MDSQLGLRNGNMLLRDTGSMWDEEIGVPSFVKEGWLRHKEMAPFHRGADGVVVSSYRLYIPNGFGNRWLETTTPSAPFKGCFAAFSLGRVHPSFSKEGTAF